LLRFARNDSIVRVSTVRITTPPPDADLPLQTYIQRYVDRYHVHFASGDEHFTSRPFVPKVA
jgi:hypothetical protein